ncbi:hypothetical protein B0A48_07254 [Cryoendolithus antarcticus]|uniref:Glutathione hydrolase n=1 Tax=Cryoendolithus antarcticus TaxID=1507870 RepID=A0A1V8T821_9PEZI|nr:hypothetical protein B0A48_07254 [Cryoendolithus antarcticus]
MYSLRHWPVLLSLASQILASPGRPHHGYHPDDKLGAVASESSICSKIGTDVLKDGGNAADSAVATVFCVGVIGMYHSGIGGGGFMLVRSSNGSYEFIDFRETAPAAAFQDMYVNNVNSSIYSGLASGVPGELRGLERLHRNYGSKSWKSLVMPAVNVARYGFPVTADLARYMASAVVGIDNFLVNDPTWALDFAPEDKLLTLNETITRKRYADTLESIANYGPDAFYNGAIAATTIKMIQTTNGTMTLADLKNYTVAIRAPAAITYRDYNIHSCSAPSSGIVAMSVMKIIETYPDIGWASTLNISTHRFDEALRFAYGQRSELGDPLFVPGLDAYQAAMLSPATVAAVRAKISDASTLNTSAYDPSGFESLPTNGTSAVVTADASGMAVSLTTTVNLLFGSHLMVPETGVILNNEMNDFSIPGASNAFGYIPSPANYIHPGKRPLSSISPSIVEHSDGSLYFVVSSAGGSRIITAVLQNLWHVLDQNATAPEALAAPRLHDQLTPNQVSFEYAYNNETVAFMKAKGHNVTWTAPGGSTAQSLRRLGNGTFEAAGEPRQVNSGGFAV